MFYRIRAWLWPARNSTTAPQAPRTAGSPINALRLVGPDVGDEPPRGAAAMIEAHLAEISRTLPRVVERGAQGQGMDGVDVPESFGDDWEYSDDGTELAYAPMASMYADDSPNLSETITGFFLRQTFIGHQLAALLAQHWLIAKCCWMPAQDAVRKGFTLQTKDGDDSPVVKLLERWNKRMKLRRNMTQFVGFGKVFGVRVAIFQVDHPDPKFYEYPFDPESVGPGMYKGIVQVDPYWCVPELDQEATANPDSMHFYEPTWWVINGKRYHRTHLCIYREGDVPDILKPTYLYGGIPVPQRVVERIYAAERVANEGPELAMAKRLITLKTDMEKMLSAGPSAVEKLRRWSQFMTNWGVKIAGTDESVEVHDTSLADFDALTMTEYQLVAAAAEVPATKLLGTSPKGFGASGDYEIESYHETLESIQAGHLQDLAEGHIERLMYSVVAPYMLARDRDWKMPSVDVVFNPLDTPTSAELATINLNNAQADAALVGIGALDGVDVRDRLISDQNSGYAGIPGAYRPGEDPEPGQVPAPQNPAQASAGGDLYGQA